MDNTISIVTNNDSYDSLTILMRLLQPWESSYVENQERISAERGMFVDQCFTFIANNTPPDGTFCSSMSQGIKTRSKK